MKNELEALKKLLSINDNTTLSVISSLLNHIHEYYPEQAVRSFYEPDADTYSRIPMSGNNPILLVQAYENLDHHCYITFFLGPKIGYELTFRIATQDVEPQANYINLLANVVNYTLLHNKYFNDTNYTIYHVGNWFKSDIKALLFLKDPILGSVKLDIGIVEYIHCFGITQHEYDELTNKGGDETLDQNKAEAFVNNLLKSNPYLVTVER